MPLLPWLYATMSFLVLVAVSPLTAAQAMLLIDRYLGGHFFDTQAGGSAMLWAHFFWIFGHPEVYVLVLAGVRVCERDHPGVFAEGDLRVSGDGGGHGGHRVHQPGRVGAPHVHDRHDVVRKCVLHAVDDAGFDSDGHQDIQLAGDDVGREAAVCDADAVFDRVSVSVGDCGADGDHAVGFAVELATA